MNPKLFYIIFLKFWINKLKNTESNHLKTEKLFSGKIVIRVLSLKDHIFRVNLPQPFYCFLLHPNDHWDLFSRSFFLSCTWPIFFAKHGTHEVVYILRSKGHELCIPLQRRHSLSFLELLRERGGKKQEYQKGILKYWLKIFKSSERGKKANNDDGK